MSENSTASKKSALLVKIPEDTYLKLKYIAMHEKKSVNKLANKIFTDYVNNHWQETRKAIEKLE